MKRKVKIIKTKADPHFSILDMAIPQLIKFMPMIKFNWYSKWKYIYRDFDGVLKLTDKKRALCWIYSDSEKNVLDCLNRAYSIIDEYTKQELMETKTYCRDLECDNSSDSMIQYYPMVRFGNNGAWSYIYKTPNGNFELTYYSNGDYFYSEDKAAEYLKQFKENFDTTKNLF